MSILSDLDRPEQIIHCDKWEQDVACRPISANELAGLQVNFASMNGTEVTSVMAMAFYANMLAITVTDPKATKEEWLNDVTADTLMDLGMKILRMNGLAVEDAKKK